MLITIARISMVGVAGLTTLLALIAALMFARFTEDAPFLLAQLISCGFVVCVGALTVLHAVSGFTAHRELLFAGAVTMAAFAAVALVTTIRLGQTTGDFEYYGIFLLLALLGQGVMTATCLWSEPEQAQRVATG